MIRLKDLGDTDKPATTPATTPDVSKTQEQLKKTYNLNLVNDAASMAKGGVEGLLFGAVAGIVVTYFFKKPIYWGAVGGAAIGGVLGYASKQAECE